METCSEHSEEIAYHDYAGHKGCPVCRDIEDLKEAYEDRIEILEMKD